MFGFGRKQPPTPAPEPVREPGLLRGEGGSRSGQIEAYWGEALANAAPKTKRGRGMDAGGSFSGLKGPRRGTVPDPLYEWFASHTFIGHQMCAILAQHWMIDKACSIPARDAVRQGFSLAFEGADTTDEHLVYAKDLGVQFGLTAHLREFVRKGRVFGIRIALFKVKSADLQYYQNPFNPDGVTAGSFQGVVQIDPFWCSPEMNSAAVMDPASGEFYEPTWWVIGGVRYHKSHLVIFRTEQPSDLLKPLYQYGGVSIPQKVMSRVYSAERTADEAPQLVMTKRLTVWSTDVAALMVNQTRFAEHMETFVNLRDNHGLKINDTDDTMQQFDTTLTGLDDAIMTQFQLAAAAAGIPGTKILETTPKGFSASGDYEESSYHETLESIQTDDLMPFLDRYFLLLCRSYIEPRFKLAPGTLRATATFNPLDSPTAKDAAEIRKLDADSDQVWATIGALDGSEVRERLRNTPESGYLGLVDAPLVADDPAPE